VGIDLLGRRCVALHGPLCTVPIGTPPPLVRNRCERISAFLRTGVFAFLTGPRPVPTIRVRWKRFPVRYRAGAPRPSSRPAPERRAPGGGAGGGAARERGTVRLMLDPNARPRAVPVSLSGPMPCGVAHTVCWERPTSLAKLSRPERASTQYVAVDRGERSRPSRRWWSERGGTAKETETESETQRMMVVIANAIRIPIATHDCLASYLAATYIAPYLYR
jgi:hypothetical protein